VFVVQPIPPEPLELLNDVAEVEVFPTLRRQITLDETIDGAKRSDYLLALHGNYIPAEVINANPDLKGVAILGGTTVYVDFDAALAAKVPVASSVMANQKSAIGGGVMVATADLTIAMLLAFAYRLLDADRYTRADATFQEQTMALMGQGCSTKTVGLIGLGQVGMHMVPRLRAFNMKLLYLKRSRLTPYEEQYLGLEYAPLGELLGRSDYLCVLVSYNPTTHNLIGAREFDLMKSTAYFINTARGRIVDQVALIDALQQNKIAGAGIEVFYDEPPRVWHPKVPEALREMENVILTPHNGGATYLSRSQQILPVAEALKMLIQGERPPGLLNPEVFGDPILHPQLYGRGPIRPAIEGGIADYGIY
jgi:glyoxylate reductase